MGKTCHQSKNIRSATRVYARPHLRYQHPRVIRSFRLGPNSQSRDSSPSNQSPRRALRTCRPRLNFELLCTPFHQPEKITMFRLKHFVLGLVALFACGVTQAQSELKPNILWITSEDNGVELGCYGDSYAQTPNIDRLASRGMKYTNCWSNAPVCAPARTTIISGLFPPCLGAQHMRSYVKPPEQAALYPEMLKSLGYYCTNNSKEDYNVIKPKGLWDESSRKAHWRKRKTGQPFFAVFNFTISHESKIRNRPHELVHDSRGSCGASLSSRCPRGSPRLGAVLRSIDRDGCAGWEGSSSA